MKTLLASSFAVMASADIQRYDFGSQAMLVETEELEGGKVHFRVTRESTYPTSQFFRRQS